MPAASESAENLLNFVNTASSNVKTVLSKPGCFKRNTNHRRFLLRQLKLSSPRKGSKESDIVKKTFALSKIKKKRNSQDCIQKCKPVSDFLYVPNDMLSKDCRFANNSRIHKQNQPPGNLLVSLTSAGTRPCQDVGTNLSGYNSVFPTLNQVDLIAGQDVNNSGTDFTAYVDDRTQSQKLCEMVDKIVDNLLDSSEFEHWSSDDDSSDVSAINSPTESWTSSVSEDHYVNPSYSDFMSGEELVESLDLSDLFIPHVQQDTFPSLPYGLSSPVQINFSPLFENGLRFFPS